MLVWSCLVLLPFGRSVELPVLIMAIWGIVLTVKRGAGWLWGDANRPFTILFLLVWVPMLVSLTDAVMLEKSLSTALTHLRLYFAGVFIIYALSDAGRWPMFLRLSAYVLVFWIADALLQAVVGYDLFGHRQVPGRLNAVFGEVHMRLGLLLAALSPLLLQHAGRNWPTWARIAVYLGLAIVLLLAGSRAGWIMMAVVVLCYGLWTWYETRRAPWRSMVAATVLALATAGVLYQVDDSFRYRVDQSLLVFEGSASDIDQAISARLPIWGTAVDMIAAHPVNGVGARGFRYAYPEFSAKDDPFVRDDPDTGAYHSHQLWLEVAAETGGIGVLGLIGFYALLLMLWLRADRQRRRIMLPAGVCLAAAFFPFNTHFAIYSSLWSQVVWWLAALYCAAWATGLHRSGEVERGQGTA